MYEEPVGYKYEPEPRREHGCFFYGCITLIVLAVLGVVAIGVIGFLGYRYLMNQILPYTSTSPVPLPQVNVAPEKVEEIKNRWKRFGDDLKAGKPTEPLVLTSDDINALIQQDPNFRGHVYVTIENGKLKGQLSMPLDKLNIPGLSGRYLNGTGEFKASMKNGVLIVTLDSLTVNGKSPSPNVMQGLRQTNWAQNLYDKPENAEAVRNLESVEIQDGKVILKARPKSEETAKPAERREAGQPAEPKESDKEKTPPEPASPKAEAEQSQPKAEGEKTQPKAEADHAQPKAA